MIVPFVRSCEGVYRQDLEHPIVNGRPHYVHETRTNYHLVWRSRSGTEKWCVRPGHDTSSYYTCTEGTEGSDDVFEITSMDGWGNSRVRVRRV